jgi:hypothetical protein
VANAATVSASSTPQVQGTRETKAKWHGSVRRVAVSCRTGRGGRQGGSLSQHPITRCENTRLRPCVVSKPVGVLA